MTASRDRWPRLALAAALATTACATRAAAPASPTPASAAPAASPAPTATKDNNNTAGIEALYRARKDSAAMRFTAADAEFMTMMIPHHMQALVMARMAPTHGASPALLTLCARIINAQNDEIATMENWLRDRGQPVPDIRIVGDSVLMHGPDGDTYVQMHGMLTADEMARLDRARGLEFDRLFLTGMIKHHSGAVDMVRHLFATPGAGEEELAFKLANDIQVDQTTEIARMQRMLSQLPSAGGAR